MSTPNQTVTLADLTKRMDDMLKGDGRKGSPPFVNPNPEKDSQPYSVYKAAALSIGAYTPDECKLEVSISDRLKKFYGDRGFATKSNSILVPAGTRYIPQLNDSEGRKIVKELNDMERATNARYDPDEVQRALGTVSDVAGGSLVPPPSLGELIDLQRNMEVFPNAGATEAPLPPNGRVSYPKLTGGSTAYWVGEAATITESAETTGNLLLEAKKLGVLVKMNNELPKFAGPVAEAMVRLDMARVGALKADLAMLEGTGGTQIKGLLTYPQTGNDPLKIHYAATNGADGDTFGVTDVAGMEGDLPDAVPSPTAWIMRRPMHAALMNRRADAVSASDAAGPFMFWITRGDAGKGPQMELFGTKVVRSNQVSLTRVKGSGTTLTYILLGYFPDWLIARMGVMEFLMNNMAETAFTNDQTWLRGIQFIDAGARHARSFVLCDQLKQQ